MSFLKKVLSIGMLSFLTVALPIQASKIEHGIICEHITADMEYMWAKGMRDLPYGLYNYHRCIGYEIEIEKGDTLERISRDLSGQLGRNVSWQDLYLENQQAINNPDLIYPRYKIYYPTQSEEYDIFYGVQEELVDASNFLQKRYCHNPFLYSIKFINVNLESFK